MTGRCVTEYSLNEMDKYLSDPRHCPHCYSTHISGDGFDADLDFVTTIITCSDCSHKWLEVYNLAAIEPYGADPCETAEPF